MDGLIDPNYRKNYALKKNIFKTPFCFIRHGSPKSHNRSSSHDSYFERKMSVQFQLENSELHTSNLDISEIQVFIS